VGEALPKNEDIYLKVRAHGREPIDGLTECYNGRRFHRACGYRALDADFPSQIEEVGRVQINDNACSWRTAAA
jgi:hypothetical protein